MATLSYFHKERESYESLRTSRVISGYERTYKGPSVRRIHPFNSSLSPAFKYTMPNSALELGFLTVATVAALFLAVLGLVGCKSRRLGRPPTPPGPKPSWFGLGSPDIPEISPWHRFMEWGKIYGRLHSYLLWRYFCLTFRRSLNLRRLDLLSRLWGSGPRHQLSQDRG